MSTRIANGIKDWVIKIRDAITTQRVPAPQFVRRPAPDEIRSTALVGRVVVEYQYPISSGVYVGEAISPVRGRADILMMMFEDEVTALCQKIPSILTERSNLRHDYLNALSQITRKIESDTRFEIGQGFGFSSNVIKVTVFIARSNAELDRCQQRLQGIRP